MEMIQLRKWKGLARLRSQTKRRRRWRWRKGNENEMTKYLRRRRNIKRKSRTKIKTYYTSGMFHLSSPSYQTNPLKEGLSQSLLGIARLYSFTSDYIN